MATEFIDAVEKGKLPAIRQIMSRASFEDLNSIFPKVYLTCTTRKTQSLSLHDAFRAQHNVLSLIVLVWALSVDAGF